MVGLPRAPRVTLLMVTRGFRIMVTQYLRTVVTIRPKNYGDTILDGRIMVTVIFHVTIILHNVSPNFHTIINMYRIVVTA